VSWDDPFWWPHRVTIRPLRAGAGAGPRLGEPVTDIPAEVDDTHRLVRTADGREVTSTGRVTVPIDTDAPLGSEVTVWPGRAAERTATVLVVSREENGAPLGDQLVLSLE
jgi:hypothetical protein